MAVGLKPHARACIECRIPATCVIHNHNHCSHDLITPQVWMIFPFCACISIPASFSRSESILLVSSDFPSDTQLRFLQRNPFLFFSGSRACSRVLHRFRILVLSVPLGVPKTKSFLLVFAPFNSCVVFSLIPPLKCNDLSQIVDGSLIRIREPRI